MPILISQNHPFRCLTNIGALYGHRTNKAKPLSDVLVELCVYPVLSNRVNDEFFFAFFSVLQSKHVHGANIGGLVRPFQMFLTWVTSNGMVIVILFVILNL